MLHNSSLIVPNSIRSPCSRRRARALRAFYGAAQTGDPGGFILVRGRWIGIPPIAASYAWIGGAYLPLVENRLRPEDIERRGDGLLVRGSVPLPPELCWRRLDDDEFAAVEEALDGAIERGDERAAAELAERLSSEQPAAVIPPL